MAMEESMKDFMDVIDAALKPLDRGDLVEGTVISILSDSIITDIHYAQDGVVYESELDRVASRYTIGELLKLVVTGFTKEGNVVLSEKKALKQFGLAALDRAKELNEPVEVLLKSIAGGGFRVDIGGIEGYLPFSLFQARYLENPEKLVGTKASVLIEKQDQRGYVFTRLPIEKAEHEKKRRQFYQTHNKGDIVSGELVAFNRGGIVVEIQGMRGFVPRSEISYSRSVNAEDLMSVGDQLTLIIRELSERDEKLVLSLKDLQANPWSEVNNHIAVGDIFEVYPQGENQYYLFYELADGLNGALSKKDLPEYMKQSQDIHVVEVVAIDREKKRIDLAYYEEVETYESEDEEEATVNLGALFGDKLKDFKF
jgi:small subunit ribosomal protein S1